MPAPILHLAATVMCAHAGQATPMSPFARVMVSGQPVVTLSSPYAVAACGLSGSGSPPCATAQWMSGATRVLAGGVPVLTVAGQSSCIPTGTPLMPLATQTRVLAS